MFARKADTQEIQLIFNYIFQRCARGKIDPPALKSEKGNRLLHLLTQLLDSEEANNDLLVQVLYESSKLSEFDVNITHIAQGLYSISDELAQANASNMAIVEQTTAGVHEIGTTIHNSLSIMEGISQKSEELLHINRKNRLHIEDIARIKELVSENSSEMASRIRELQETAHKVDEIVQGVRGIAEQTNLLALNASIEAARAGEQGRGFSVVAEEIRKLAESTKSKLTDMQAFTSSIQSASQQGSLSLQATIDSVADMDANIEKISETFQLSLENTEHTVQGIGELSSLLRGLNNSSDEINTAINVVASETERISAKSALLASRAEEAEVYSHKISEIDDALFLIIRDLMQISNQSSHPLDNNVLVEALQNAITSHREWLDRLREIVSSQEIHPIQKNGKKCAFGHFYGSIDVHHPLIREEWSSIDDIHLRLHRSAELVTAAIEEERPEKAKQAFEEAERMSSVIIEKMQDIIRKIGKIEEKAERVFALTEAAQYI